MFNLCFYGRGGFSWSDVYCNMPAPYRKIYITMINEALKKEADQMKKKGKNSDDGPSNDEVLAQMQKAAAMDKNNKTGLNIAQRLKDASKPNKIDKYYDR